MKARPWLLWILAFLLTAVSALYQRYTGPTWPVRGTTDIDGAKVSFRMSRSYDGPDDAPVRIQAPDAALSGRILFKRYRSNDEYVFLPMARDGEFLVGRLPHQPPAGKVMYQVQLQRNGQDYVPLTPNPVVLRFRGEVGLGILILHVILIFGAMLFSTRAGVEALARGGSVGSMAGWTCVLLFAGGMILGPIVQKLAFDAYWTGWPFGQDLTDNKTAAAFLAWLAAWWKLRKDPESRGWAVTAAIITLVVFAIPHSVLGSELDYTKPLR